MALVIIDMQDGFDPEATEAESGVLALIKKAKARHEAIFLVTFAFNGRTLRSILAALKSYPLLFHVQKWEIDGGKNLSRSISRAWGRGFIEKFSKMRFCGVLTSQCVTHTLLSLCSRAESIERHDESTAIHKGTVMELVSSACKDDFDSEKFSLYLAKSYRSYFPRLKVA